MGSSTDLANLVIAFDMVMIFLVCMTFIGTIGWINIQNAMTTNSMVSARELLFTWIFGWGLTSLT